jgi:hypothetical protein
MKQGEGKKGEITDLQETSAMLCDWSGLEVTTALRPAR